MREEFEDVRSELDTLRATVHADGVRWESRSSETCHEPRSRLPHLKTRQKRNNYLAEYGPKCSDQKKVKIDTPDLDHL